MVIKSTSIDLSENVNEETETENVDKTDKQKSTINGAYIFVCLFVLGLVCIHI